MYQNQNAKQSIDQPPDEYLVNTINSLSEPEEKEGLFDGRIMKERMARFLHRINEGLKEAQDHLPDFEIQAIEVNTVIGLNGEFTFPMAGFGANYSRAITFQLKPKTK